MNKRYGKMVKIAALSLICGLLLSSCTFGLPGRKIEEDGAAVEKKCKMIIQAIEKRDEGELKSLFSKKALSEAKNLDENMEYIFNLWDGKVKSIEDDGVNTDEDIEYGDNRKQIKAWLNVESSEGEYILFLIDYPVDDFDSNNIGLYALRLVKKEDEQTQLTYWQDMQIPGVYKPEEE